jgi:hypothetical protein
MELRKEDSYKGVSQGSREGYDPYPKGSGTVVTQNDNYARFSLRGSMPKDAF